jgi:EAL domain-containing protein (putative c-di-GMP-specific phosphodiesterase class I)
MHEEMTSVSIGQGNTIFREGDEADVAYLVEAGAIEIFVERPAGEQILAVLGPGELFGEMGVIDGAPRSAAARALTECRLLSVDGSQIRNLLTRGDPFHAALLRKLIVRFRGAQKTMLDGSDGDGAGPSAPEESEFAWLTQEKGIADALSRGEIESFYQPIVEMEHRRPIGFESLARWRKPDGTLVSPADFLPLAERTGLVRKIDLTLARRALALCSRFSPTAPILSINLSAWNFSDMTVVEHLRSALESSGYDPRLVKAEVTESSMFDAPERALSILTELKALGIRLALDDFGTGYSSLSMLHKMPFDTVKIDRGFIVDSATNAKSRNMVRAIVGIADDLGMDVIAEGIEDEAAERMLLDMGCRYAQGFMYSRPLPVEKASSYWSEMTAERSCV